jgi:hypothetical protein
MNCPHCNQPIPPAELNRHFASHGGKSSKRKITPEQQRVMQAARNAAMQRRIRDRENLSQRGKDN